MVRFATQPDDRDEPKRYRLITVSVEAVRLSKTNLRTASVWCGGLPIEETDVLEPSLKYVALNIPTVNGVKRASEGQYILKSSDGTFSVMDALEFERRYELV